MSDERRPRPSCPNPRIPHAAEFAVLEALKAEVESLKDQRLRALAEVENIRRRAEREKAEASQYAVTKFARDMVGIADNFARALAAVPARCARGRRSAGQGGAGWRGSHRPAVDRRPWSAMASSRSTPATASSIPTCIRRSPKCRATASRRAASWMWCSPAIMIGDRLLRPAMVTVARRKTCPRQPPSVDTKV